MTMKDYGKDPFITNIETATLEIQTIEQQFGLVNCFK